MRAVDRVTLWFTAGRRKRLYRIGWVALTILAMRGLVLPGEVDLYLLAFSALLGMADKNTDPGYAPRHEVA